MTDFIQIKTPEDVDKIEPVDFDNVTNGFTIRMQEGAKHYHLGSLNVSRLIKDICAIKCVGCILSSLDIDLRGLELGFGRFGGFGGWMGAEQ